MKLHYRKLGQGPSLMILHGLYGSSDNWASIGREVSTQYEVYLVDLRNHGRSPHAAPHDYPTLQADILELLHQIRRSKVHLVGHSMGGKVAMLFALTHPEYIASLSIIDIAPKAYTANEIGSGRAAEHRLILQTLTALNLDEITSRTQAENFFESRISHAPTRQFLLKNLKRTQSGFEWGINLGLLAQSLPQIMEAIQPPLESKPPQFPTLFVRGANSDYILDSDIPAISTLFPTAQYCTIPKAGHWIHAEQPALFISTLINFVKSV